MIRLISPLTQIDSSANFTVGTRTTTKNGNEYIYLPGVALVAQYDWVIYNTSATSLSYGSVTRANILKIGPVAIAQAAIVEGKFGWFLNKGMGWGNCGQTISGGTSALYATGTVGRAGGSVTYGSLIAGAFGISTGVSGGTVKALLNYPFMTGTLS